MKTRVRGGRLQGSARYAGAVGPLRPLCADATTLLTRVQLVGDLRLGWEPVSKQILLQRLQKLFTAYPLPPPA